jgi:hypothetical protein
VAWAKWIGEEEGKSKKRRPRVAGRGGRYVKGKFKNSRAWASQGGSGGHSDLGASGRYTGKSKAPPLRSGAGYRVKEDDKVKGGAEKN